MKNKTAATRRLLRLLNFCILTSAFCILCACHRGPQTATELFDHMPRRFTGELRLQGETGTRTLTVEVLDVNVRDAHLLEFKRIRYHLSHGEEASGEAGLAGTISAPGGEIRIEDASGGAAGDALKPGSFQGKLSGDLQSVDAEWTTAFGQTIKFAGKAGG